MYQPNILITANNNYLDLLRQNRVYEIVRIENLFGEDTFILKDTISDKVLGWNFKKYELDINTVINGRPQQL